MSRSRSRSGPERDLIWTGPGPDLGPGMGPGPELDNSTFILEHVIISDLRLLSPGVVLTVKTILVTINCDAITKNGADLSWSGSSGNQMVSFQLILDN